MQVVLTAVFPVFGIIFLGYLTGVTGKFKPEDNIVLGRFALWIAFPALLFIKMAKADINGLFNLPFILTILACIYILHLIAITIGKRLFPDIPKAIALHSLGSMYPNVGWLGLPIFVVALPASYIQPAIIAIIIYNIFALNTAIVMIEHNLDQKTGFFSLIKKTLTSLFKSPVFLPPILGIIISLFAISIPKGMDTFVTLLGDATFPAALFSIGLAMVDKQNMRMENNLREVIWVVVMKLFVQPLIAFIFGYYVFHLEPIFLHTAILMAAMPTAPTTFIIGQHYNVYTNRAITIVVVTTILSIFTISGLLILFQ
ncbi:MAG: AEC family transporter [Alphaproteobacteria bacterium]